MPTEYRVALYTRLVRAAFITVRVTVNRIRVRVWYDKGLVLVLGLGLLLGLGLVLAVHQLLTEQSM